MIVGHTIEIAQSPREVYDFLVDQGSWAKLDPALTDLTPRGEVALGMSGTMTRRVSGMKVTTAWTVTEVAPASRLTMVITGRGYELRETTSLAPAAAGTQVKIVDTLTPTSFGGRFFVAVSGRFVRRDLEARAGRLRRSLGDAFYQGADGSDADMAHEHGNRYGTAMEYKTPEEEWRAILTGQHKGMLALRKGFGHMPSAPRCKLCLAPFHGPAALVLKPLGFGPWERHPQLCKNCMRGLTKQGVGGAEVEISMLFADIRGSTGLGERLKPAEFSVLLGSFYRLAADAITGNMGILDKFVGDEAIGLFVPAYTGTNHAEAAIRAAREILRKVAQPDASTSGPIPVGAAVHTGIAYVGTLGSSEDISDFTALGDNVNTTARLASLAGAGELLVSVAAAEHAGVRTEGLERRTVEVRGRQADLEVYAIALSPVTAAA